MNTPNASFDAPKPQRASASIGNRILIRSLAIGLIPLVFIGLVVFVGLSSLNETAATRADESRALLSEESVAVASQEQASTVSREINLLLNERIRNAQAWARSTEVITAARDGSLRAVELELVGRPIDELEAEFASTKQLPFGTSARNFLRGELEANTDFREIFFTESNGYNVAYTNETSDFVQSDEDWWTGAMVNGLDISDVDYDDSAGVFSVDISVRIDDPATGRSVGVLKTSLSIGFVQDFADSRSTADVDYIVALADGRLIADTQSDHDSLRMMTTSFAGATASPGLGTAMEAGLEPGEGAVEITDDFVYGYTTTLDPTLFEGIDADGFAGFDWIVVSAQNSEAAFAPLRGVESLKTDIADAGNSLRTLIVVMLLVGIGVAVWMARQTAAGIVRPIQQLTDASTAAAEVGLLRAVEQVNADGADLDSIEAPKVEIATGDELETLASAFNSVQSVAVRLAAEQAQSRRNTTEMFVNLGRRNQSLLKRQLRFIDSLEANEQDPDTLESLFKLDHLATRMRRNAESLLVLAGDRSPRRWAKPIEMQTAMEAALAEVESYDRVNLVSIESGQIQGNIVADVAHILAEVIENGLNFSPPTAEVTVVGRNAGEHYIVTITDEGFGMKQDEIDRVNEQLATTIEITEVPTQQLGLFVVARLASRHGIQVKLGNASTGGLSVRLEVPLAEQKTEMVEPTPADRRPKHEETDEVQAVLAANAEVQELLSKAEAAVARAEAIYASRKREDLAEEEHRLAELRRKVEGPPSSSTNRAAASEIVADDAETAAPAANDAAVATTGDSVEVGGFSFPRRGDATPVEVPDVTPKPRRRASDEAAPEAESIPPQAAAAVDEFGFKRRESKRPLAEAKTGGQRKSDPKPASPKNDDVVEVAEKSRNQWGSFQRGKSEAEQVTPETAANAAEKKES